MLALRVNRLALSTFSVFVDCRLLRLHLAGNLLPFSEDVIYIFEKQIEEAALVVINKTDLLSAARLQEVADLFRLAYPEKTFLLQNTLVPHGVDAWMDALSRGGAPLPEAALEINYQRYGAGEAQLAWLDETWTLPVQGRNGHDLILQAIEGIVSALKKKNIPIGHLKFLVEAGDVHVKLSLTTLEQSGWLDELPQLNAPTIRLLINGRVQMDAGQFKDLVDGTLKSNGIQPVVNCSSAFHPGQPQPTHRFIQNASGDPL